MCFRVVRFCIFCVTTLTPLVLFAEWTSPQKVCPSLELPSSHQEEYALRSIARPLPLPLDDILVMDSEGNATTIWNDFDGIKSHVRVASKQFGGAWQETVTLGFTSYCATCANIAVDPKGAITAVWVYDDGNYVSIQSSYKPYGGDWQETPDTIVRWEVPSDLRRDPFDFYIWAPKVVVDRAGNTTIAWTKCFKKYFSIQACFKPFGGKWQAIETLSLPDIDSDDVEIAVDTHGTVTAIWLSEKRHEFNNKFVCASSKPLGGEWQKDPEIISPGEISNYCILRIAVDPEGNVTVLWRNQVGIDSFIRSSSKPVGGVWQKTPDTLSQSVEFDACCYRLVADAFGTVTALWMGTEKNILVIHASSKPRGGSWQKTPDRISQEGQNAYYPQVAVDGSGNLVAVWMSVIPCEGDSFSLTGPFIQASFKPYGKTWSEPTPLSEKRECASYPPLTRCALYPQVTMNNSGHAIVIWQDFDQTKASIQSTENQ